MRALTISQRWWMPGMFVMTAALAVWSWEALSDEPPVTDKPHRVPVAVLDVAKVFKQSRGFNSKMNEIKRQIEVFEAELRGRQAELLKLARQNPDSSPSSDLSAEKIEELSKKMQADVAARRTEFLQVEARVYFEQYQRIEKAVTQLAQARDIGTVLRSNSEPMNPADRTSVLQGVNRDIVFNSSPDLTDAVIAALNSEKP